MTTLYRVKNWKKLYEKAQTRKVLNAQWVAVPVKHDGKGFRRLMMMKNGPALYGAWVIILQVAAKCTVRGTLADDEGPLTPEDLCLKTGCPQSVIEQALQVVSSKQIGWLLAEESANSLESSANTLEPPDTSLQLQDSTGQDITGQDRTEQDNGAAEPLVPAVFAHYRTYHPKQFPSPSSKSKEWRLIADRLREGYSVPDLCAAIDGIHKSPFHCGQNDKGTKYQTLALCMRDASQVGKFMEYATTRAGPVLSEKSMRTQSAIDQFVLEREGTHG